MSREEDTALKGKKCSSNTHTVGWPAVLSTMAVLLGLRIGSSTKVPIKSRVVIADTLASVGRDCERGFAL